MYCLSDELPLKHTIASSMEFCWWGWYKDKKACDSLTKIGQTLSSLSCPGFPLAIDVWLSLKWRCNDKWLYRFIGKA